ncbi:MAG TPA: malto-oligosyltrehalose synthase [Caulobacteraceae bacterium]|jgi:(1->4)-alpha-D-glucan 1-alpha-D-glucosylmutase
MIPRATYRLQFHAGFPFAAAIPLAPYLAQLGVSHVYASPIATARTGSAHGYDVVDPTTINPELGGEAGFRELAAALKAHGLGLILDIVPNHLAVGHADNRWWNDVLEKGESSDFAQLFDIDWRGPDPALQGKLLAPFLGAPYGEALAAGDVRLKLDEDGSFAVWAYDTHRFPIRRQDYDHILAQGLDWFDPADPEGRARLHALMDRQHWRLAWWRTAGDEINWRRFFDITTLAGVRVERSDAFELLHGLPLRLYAEGLIDGLRADHVDGLVDPGSYGRTLRNRLARLREGEHAYVVFEKVLGEGETLAPDWGVDGTTGYDFMDEVSRLLHDGAGSAALAGFWSQVSGRPASFAAEETAARGQVLLTMFGAQLIAATRAFHALARHDLATRDISRGAIERALIAMATGLPAYRTYATAAGMPDWGRPVLEQDVEAAQGLAAQWEAQTLDQIAAWLKGEGEPTLRGEAARRWQQLSAPVAAKAVEDTAFYRYGALLSRNDVGSHPARFAASIADTHAAFAARSAAFPRAMLTTATHDHKRGEDVRARLAVLSEVPQVWIEAAQRWRQLNAPLRSGADLAVDPGDELMLYQTLVGAWPLDPAERAPDGLAQLRDRVAGWQEKALREAKLRSSWAEPDGAYEQRCRAFLAALMDPARSAPFLGGVSEFVDRIAAAGALNSLSQTVLRCAAPGVPDLYQGAELWDLSLVDPDNRRPVDYAARQQALAAGRSPADLVGTWRDGRLKQAILARALKAKAGNAALAAGDYLALPAAGPRASSVLAFARRQGAQMAVVVAAVRCAEALLGKATPMPDADWWEGTCVALPAPFAGAAFENALDGARAGGPSLALEAVLRQLPVAILVAGD